ncbi:MAG: hypothetical protein ERJ67_07495 [Aphanocapsa feldmannii 277cV]|uniref:Phosphate ABC transporter permease n=2 Tax=Aphanocapsa feldmannii TaxID=192050 RepID=A0A524RMH5_9CHRO|nr:MAG: hypothetical protein ERJ67_07495 [Aphanocapsa feldmannii 277cV]TGH21766.1 MAG: hypothetical protein ERJ68_05195 [Aphanocapsa feldmannii 277cI]
MLVPLKEGELNQLIPIVATGPQFNFCWGTPQQVLQRALISAIGAVISLLLGQSLGVGSSWGPLWLVVGIVFGLYWLWEPLATAARRNGRLRSLTMAAIVEAEVVDLFTQERISERREDVSASGRLELVESKRTWLSLELEDEGGYIGRLSFPLARAHQTIRRGEVVCCLAFSPRRDFSRITDLSDAWLPGMDIWVGDYPYLRRELFEELCGRRLRRH